MSADCVRIESEERCGYCNEVARDGERIYLVPIGGGWSWVHAEACAPLCFGMDDEPLIQSPGVEPAIAMVGGAR